MAGALDAAFSSGRLPGLHAVLVARDGEVLLERYYAGDDEVWGRSIGRVVFGPDTLHDLRSVTKSVVSLLYGIALDRGLVPPPDAPLLAHFPEYPDLLADPQRARMTVAQALDMTLPLEWNEALPYTDPANSEVAMEQATDRYRFILGQPVRETAGRWTYSGGAVALVGALIERGSRLNLPDFAQQALFAPLGISGAEWTKGADGVASAASGLRLRARDLLRIGQMVLARGRWDGREVVPLTWLEASFRPSAQTPDGLGYGRLWYLGRAPTPALLAPGRWIAGFGNGGQRLWLMPECGLTAVVFSGAYDVPRNWVTSNLLWRDIILAGLRPT